MSAIERRYAVALMDALKVKDEQLKADKDLAEIAYMFNNNLQFKKILLDPRLEPRLKSDVVKEIFVDDNPMLVSFISLLIDKNRIKYIDGISKEYSELARNKNNEIKLKIISATGLTDDEINGITDKYKKVYNATNASYEQVIDESVIGGVKVIIGNKVYDGTVKTQLNNML